MTAKPQKENIAFTVWYNDLPVLDVWLKYYSQWFDKLHVICCHTKEKYLPELEERQKKYNLTIERTDSHFEDAKTANERIREVQRNFCNDYHWVLFTNCDEIIAPDPQYYKDFHDFLQNYWGDWVPCVCYEIIEKDEPPIDFTKPILKQRQWYVKNEFMNKVLLSKVPLLWNEGQHQIAGIDGEVSKRINNTNLYLFHLRHFNLKDEEKNPRDFGPFAHLPVATIIERANDERFLEKIPEWVGELI